LHGIWLIPEKLDDNSQVLLYFHAGGMLAGSAEGEGFVQAQVAIQLGMKTLSVNYRLLPENSFRESIADGVAAYQYLLAHGSSENIMVMGCSSGGGMALYTLLELIQSHIPLPVGAILGSPGPGMEFVTGKKIRDYDSYYLPRCMTAVLDNYTLALFEDYWYTEDNEKYMKELLTEIDQLPPIFYIVSELETHRDLLVEFFDVVQKRGVNIEMNFYPKMIHCFVLGIGFHVAESESVINEVKEWISTRWVSHGN